MAPRNVFPFAGTHQTEINGLTQALNDVLKAHKPDPHVALASLSAIVGSVIENNFQYCANAEHLETLIQQTLESYADTIIHAAENIMQTQFSRSFNDKDERYRHSLGRLSVSLL